jgi:hypothetical protein
MSDVECFITFEPGQDIAYEADVALTFLESCAEAGMDMDRLILGMLTAISYLSPNLDDDLDDEIN